MENIDFKIILGDLLDESKNWALGIIKENETEMLELKRELGIDEIDFGSDKAVKFQKLVSDKMESAENFDQYQKFNILYTALWTIATSLKIDLNKNNDYETAVRIYWLGRTHGSLESVVPQLMPDILLENHFHSLKSSYFVKERWQKRDEEYIEPCELSEKKWKNGDDALHHEMAEYLVSKYPNCNYRVLLKKLRPIAKKYNRLFGMKGVKKEI